MVEHVSICMQRKQRDKSKRLRVPVFAEPCRMEDKMLGSESVGTGAFISPGGVKKKSLIFFAKRRPQWEIDINAADSRSASPQRGSDNHVRI